MIIGQQFQTNNYGTIEIVDLLPKSNATVRFTDGTEVIASTSNILKGSVRNPFAPVIFGVAYNGIGPHKQHNTLSHAYWYKMLQRGYCQNYKSKHPTYDDIIVCDEWLCYQTFADWCTKRKQYGKKGFNLDKDLLLKGNKVYHPDYCSLVPQAVNKLTVRKNFERGLPQGVVDYGGYFVAKCRTEKESIYLGTFQCPEKAGEVYRKFKKEVIIKTAIKYKDDLDDNVFQALLDFEVDR